MRALRWLLGFVVRLISTILIITFGVSLALEISIPNGFRGVIFPEGMPPPGARSPRAQAAIDAFHLDDSWVIRWLKWLGDAARGDFGISTDRGGTEVLELMTPRFPISIQLMLFATTLAIVIGVPLGIAAASWRTRFTGKVLDGFIGVFQSVPIFITPIFLVWVFALTLNWLPAAGWTRISTSLSGNLKGILLPGFALAFTEIGFVARVIKSDITEVLQMDYITAAVAKGLPARYVMVRHALRPASLGLLNVIGLNIGALLAGSFVVEFIFGIGALGNLFLGSLVNRDMHLLMAMTVYVVAVYVILNGIVDAAMHAADPRIRRR